MTSGCAFLAGTSINKIYSLASSLISDKGLYNAMSKPQYIYGKGNSSTIISEIINNYFSNNIRSSILFNKINYKEIISKYDNYSLKDSVIDESKDESYDIVVVLTVWKRNNLEKQLNRIKNQSILKNKKTNIIIFQNSNHIYINDIVLKWKSTKLFSEKVDITFIQSQLDILAVLLYL